MIRINGEPLESKLLLKTESSDNLHGDNSGTTNAHVINEKSETSDWSEGQESTPIVYQVGPFAESSTVTLECSTTGGRPIPEVKWFNGSRPLRSKVNLFNRETGPSVTSTIRLVVTRNDVGVKLGCRVWNNATKVPLTKWISLEIHGKSKHQRIEKKIHNLPFFSLDLYFYSVYLSYHYLSLSLSNNHFPSHHFHSQSVKYNNLFSIFINFPPQFFRYIRSRTLILIFHPPTMLLLSKRCKEYIYRYNRLSIIFIKHNEH